MDRSHHSEEQPQTRQQQPASNSQSKTQRVSLLTTPHVREVTDALYDNMASITKDLFVKALQDPSKHDCIWEWIVELDSTNAEFQREVETLSKSNEQLTELNTQLQVEDHDLGKEIKALKEKASATQALAETYRTEMVAAHRQATPGSTSSAVNVKKSSRIPDPQAFFTGTHDEWEVFKVQLHDKLTVNSDHFPDEAARLAYVRTRLGGEALQIALPVSQAPEATYSSVILALNDRYADPVAERTARRNYTKLYQGSKEFASFLGEFQKYAAMAKIPENQQLDDLREKVTPKVQEAIAAFVTTDFRELIGRLHEVTRNLNQATAIRNRAGATSNRNNAGGESTRKPDSTATAPAQALSDSFSPPSTTRSSAQLLRQDRDPYTRGCLNCGKEGHIARNCQEKEQPGFHSRLQAFRERYQARQQQRRQIAPVELPAGLPASTPNVSGNEESAAESQ